MNNIVSWKRATLQTCRWHARHGDVAWAKKYLTTLVDAHVLTEEDAAEIRQEVGWETQLTLFDLSGPPQQQTYS